MFYTLFNDSIKAQKLVDYHAVFHLCSSPTALLLLPLASVAALGPVVALKYTAPDRVAEAVALEKV